jgi:hypothetical protein
MTGEKGFKGCPKFEKERHNGSFVTIISILIMHEEANLYSDNKY